MKIIHIFVYNHPLVIEHFSHFGARAIFFLRSGDSELLKHEIAQKKLTTKFLHWDQSEGFDEGFDVFVEKFFTEDFEKLEKIYLFVPAKEASKLKQALSQRIHDLGFQFRSNEVFKSSLNQGTPYFLGSSIDTDGNRSISIEDYNKSKLFTKTMVPASLIRDIGLPSN